MITEIAAAFNAVKLSTDLLTLARKVKTDAAVLDKAIELQTAMIGLQEIMMRLQEQNSTLTAAKHELEQKIVACERWNEEKERYALYQPAPGVIVYASKPDDSSTEPQHWLCAQCYQQRQKSFVQRGEIVPMYGVLYHCSRCRAHFYLPAIPPEV